MTLGTIGCTLLSLLVTSSAWAGGPATPQGTAFTYQGVLKSGGALSSGVFDFEFRLFDVPAGGTALGTMTLADQTVSEGLFTAALDFGASAFNGQERWLEIQVDATTLIPRQKFEAAPYALFALSADGPNLTNLNASNLASGTVPNAQLSGTYAGALALTNASNAIAGTFTGSGAGLTTLNATNIASGSLATARLPTGGTWALASNLNIDASTLVIDQANNRVGIGTTSPSAPLHVRTNVPFLVLQDTASALTQTGYIDFRNNTFVETAWVGFGLVGSPDFSIVNARTDGDILLTPFDGNVGIGTSTPTAKLEVHGDIRLGSSGQYRAPAAEENLRIVRGAVSGTSAAILEGSGFTASRIEQGRYFIFLNTPFADIPCVTANTLTVHFSACFIELYSVNPGQFVVEVVRRSDGAYVDGHFNFIAVGPR